jgi:hypothetical protein
MSIDDLSTHHCRVNMLFLYNCKSCICIWLHIRCPLQLLLLVQKHSYCINMLSCKCSLQLKNPITSLIATPRNHFHSNPCVYNLCPNQSFLWIYKCDYPPWHFVKVICSHINNYKTVCNYICDLCLQLMLIWMKMKMKSTLILSIYNDIPK